MPYDGSGNFTIINNFEEDRINGVSIDSLKMDNNFNDVANGLSNAVLRSGAAAMTGVLNMASHKIQNVTNGTATSDAINKGQLDALSNACVKLSGTQTITGTKYFENHITSKMSSAAFGFRAQSTVVQRGTIPSSATNFQWVAQGANGLDVNTRFGGMYVHYNDNGDIYTEITAYKPEAYDASTNPNIRASIRVTYPVSGSAYTYAPHPTTLNDTDSNEHQIATVKTVNTLDSSAVHKTGNETIAGTKTFSSTISGSINGNAATVTNGVYTTGNQTIGGTKTFSAVAYGKASDANNSILTTVDKTKAANGYFKFGNGMIIQWGSTGQGTEKTVELPIDFSNTNYKVVLTPLYNAVGVTCSTYDYTTSTFKVLNSRNDVTLHYIAIGY